MGHMNHDEDYPETYLAEILKSVRTIAMVGASKDRTRFSYGVLRVLHETGYEMIPVNPGIAGQTIRGLKVYPSLTSHRPPRRHGPGVPELGRTTSDRPRIGEYRGQGPVGPDRRPQ